MVVVSEALAVESAVVGFAVEPPLQQTLCVSRCCRTSTALQRSTALYNRCRVLQLYIHYILQRSTSPLSTAASSVGRRAGRMRLRRRSRQLVNERAGEAL